MAEITEHPFLTNVPLHPSHIKNSLLQRMRLMAEKDFNFKVREATIRNGKIKQKRKEKGQLILKDDLAR